MLDREPFLKAIFANPADNLPRLVFADYLEERGEGEWAQLIRLECELHPKGSNDGILYGRGFRLDRTIRIAVDQLNSAERFRMLASSDHPEWYGALSLKITGGRIAAEMLIATLSSPVTEHVIDLDLSGEVIETPAILNDIATNQGIPVFDMDTRPVVTLAAVEALAQSRDSRRLISLNLENNDLDNDAARALIRSPNFLRLQRLSLFKGNRFRATVWQQLHQKFGPNVVDPAPDDVA